MRFGSLVVAGMVQTRTISKIEAANEVVEGKDSGNSSVTQNGVH